MVERLVNKIRDHADEIVMVEERDTRDAEVVIVAYGITVRPALQAIALARREGIRVGLLKLITAWPFPEKAVRALAARVPLLVVPEINYGQMVARGRALRGGPGEDRAHPVRRRQDPHARDDPPGRQGELAALRDPSGRRTP